MTFSGNEHIIYDGMPTGYTLMDFWDWSTQHLMNIYPCSTFCTFIVAVALDIDPASQHPNDRYDLTLSRQELHFCHNIRIAVNRFSQSYSDISIFCEHTEQVDSTPLILDNWSFYIVPSLGSIPIHIVQADFRNIRDAIHRCIYLSS